MTPDAHEGRDRVLQFGTGRFLRGFVDAFLHEENLANGPCRRCDTAERDRGGDLGLGGSAPVARRRAAGTASWFAAATRAASWMKAGSST